MVACCRHVYDWSPTGGSSLVKGSVRAHNLHCHLVTQQWHCTAATLLPAVVHPQGYICTQVATTGVVFSGIYYCTLNHQPTVTIVRCPRYPHYRDVQREATGGRFPGNSCFLGNGREKFELREFPSYGNFPSLGKFPWLGKFSWLGKLPYHGKFLYSQGHNFLVRYPNCIL